MREYILYNLIYRKFKNWQNESMGTEIRTMIVMWGVDWLESSMRMLTGVMEICDILFGVAATWVYILVKV